MFISNFYQLHNVWHIRWTVQRRQYCHTTADYRFAHDFKCRIQRLWLGEGRRYRGSKVPSGLQGQSPWWRLRGKSQRKRRFGGGVFKCSPRCFGELSEDLVEMCTYENVCCSLHFYRALFLMRENDIRIQNSPTEFRRAREQQPHQQGRWIQRCRKNLRFSIEVGYYLGSGLRSVHS